MKELSIEDKAKRYDEAIERAKNYYSTTDSASDIKLIGLIFPELKECEDKMMIQYFKDLAPFDKAEELYEKYGFSHKDAIAWLEKQAEHANFRNKIQIGDKVTRNEDGVLVNLSQLNRVAKKDDKQGEQKPVVNDNAKEMFIKALERVEEQNNKGYKLTDCDKNSWWEDFKAYTSCTIEQKPTGWSEKLIADVFEMVGLAKIVREQENDALTRALQSAMIELAKYSVVPQIRQEWSEEDEKMLNDIIKDLVHPWNEYIPDRIEDEIKWLKNWLKSLRPQNRWKPNEEQMDALRYVTNFDYGGHKATLVSLYEQLKKLK